MKKITLFIALLMAWGISAQNATTLNNPKDVNGNVIYQWDCTANTFAATNNYEIDQNVVFAVDVTGTPLESWLTQSPTGFIRDIAFSFWTQWGGQVDGRFAQIKGNIYGATLNFKQLITSRQLQLTMLQGQVSGDPAVTNALTVGTITQIYGTVFGFSYSPTDATKDGNEWYTDAMNTVISTTTLPYTGTKTSPEFYNSDYNFFYPESNTWDGYAPPCVTLVAQGLNNTYVSNSPIVAYEYYSILGGRLQLKPETGLFIQKAIREDGTSLTTKMFREAK